MAGLLKRIKESYPDAARELEKADFRSDVDIRTLTRDDLHELLHGPEKLKQRKAVYELIHQQKPIGELLKDLKSFIPAESLTAALTENGVLSGYLQIMKDLTSQVEKVHSFLQAHVCLLEENSYDYKAAKVARTGSNAQQGSNLPPPKITHTGSNVQHGRNVPPTPTRVNIAKEQPASNLSKPTGESAATGIWHGICSSLGYGQKDVGSSASSPESSQSDCFEHISDTDQAPHPTNVDPDKPPRAHEVQPVAEVSSSVATQQIKLPTVKFLSIVSGKTLNCENTLLDRLRNQGKVTLVETEDNPQLIIVFCPITSRIESDLESVMNKRPESLVDKPVILVMMHHAHKPNEGVIQKPGSVLRKWNILLDVNVFYHETVHGLLRCSTNTEAVTEMHTTLLKHCESVNSGDGAKLDTCSDNSSAPESLVRAGDYNMGDVVLLARDPNACTSYGISQSTSSSSIYGSHDNQGCRVHSVDTRPSGSSRIRGNGTHAFQGNQVGNVGNVVTSRSSNLMGDNDTSFRSLRQPGNVGHASTLDSGSSGTGGNDHNAGNVEKGTRVKKSRFEC